MVSRSRVLIENVTPIIDSGEYISKRIVNEILLVEADLIADGHDLLNGCLKFRKKGKKNWQEFPLTYLANNRWCATVELQELGVYEYTIEAWVDYLLTWQYNLRKKVDDKQNVVVELQDSIDSLNKLLNVAQKPDIEQLKDVIKRIGDNDDYEQVVDTVCSEAFEKLLRKYPAKEFANEYERILSVRAEHSKAEFSTWYEFFPRGKPPECAYFDPWLTIEMGPGLEIIR